ncbi:MAG: hypothetical protein V3S19_01815 [Gemmatimonadales bacterium]
MWSLLPRRLQLFCVVIPTIVIVWAAEAVVSMAGGAETNPLKHASLVALIIGGVLTPLANMFWRKLWRWFPAIERATFPDLNGTWEGDFVTTWKDPDTGTTPPPIPATVSIRQTLFSTAVSLRTGESHSHSTRCHLEADHGAQIYRIWYSYDNRPKAEVSHRSARHEGVAWLELNLSEDQDRLAGQYFTDRRTTGDMNLRRTSSSPT